MTTDLVRLLLACALVGFAAPVAGYHLPSVVPALRRILRERR